MRIKRSAAPAAELVHTTETTAATEPAAQTEEVAEMPVKKAPPPRDVRAEVERAASPYTGGIGAQVIPQFIADAVNSVLFGDEEDGLRVIAAHFGRVSEGNRVVGANMLAAVARLLAREDDAREVVAALKAIR